MLARYARLSGATGAGIALICNDFRLKFRAGFSFLLQTRIEIPPKNLITFNCNKMGVACSSASCSTVAKSVVFGRPIELTYFYNDLDKPVTVTVFGKDITIQANTNVHVATIGGSSSIKVDGRKAGTIAAGSAVYLSSLVQPM